MAAETQGSRPDSTTAVPPWWRDERKRGLAAQILVGLILAGAIWFLIRNLLVNQERLGVPMSFRFLDGPAGFQIGRASCRERVCT